MRKHTLRFRRLVVTLVLVAIAGTSLAPATTLYAGDTDDAESIVITGSGYMQDLLQDMLETYAAETDLDAERYRVDSEGSGPGFDVLCAGESDANMSTQAITDAQVLRCTDNEVDFVELILGVDHAVLAVDADSQLSCLSTSDFARIFRRNDDLTLDRVLPGASADETVTVYGPSDENAAFTYMRATFLNNVDPTIDETFETPADVVADLTDAGDNALALMTFADWQALEQEGLKLVDIRANENAECVTPDRETLSTNDYPASRLLYLYANANSLQDTEMGLFLDYFLGDNEAPVEERPIFAAVRAAGFEPPVTAILNRNRLNYSELLVGRTFTRTDNPTLVNTAAEGTITVAGNPLSIHITNSLFAAFGTTYELAEVEFDTFGEDAAWEALCNSDTSVIQVGLNSEAPADCGVTPFEVVLGADGVVFLTAADSPLPVCLDYTQIADLLVRTDLPAPASTDAEGDAADTSEDGMIDEAENTTDDTDATEAEASVETTEDAETTADDANEGETANETDADTDTDAEGDEQEETPTPPDFDDPQGPTMWSEVAPDWAADNDDLPIVVLVPQLAALETDLVTSVVSPGAVLRRTDQPTIREADASSGLNALDYRFFSTAMLDGAITYLRWSDYQNAPNIDDLRVVDIQNLEGDCITASPDTIASGEYPFTFSARLVFAQESLTDSLIANLLWHTFNRDVLATLDDEGLVGFERVELDTERENVFALLEDVAAAQQEAEAEGTDATGEDATQDGVDGDVEDATDATPSEELGAGQRDDQTTSAAESEDAATEEPSTDDTEDAATDAEPGSEDSSTGDETDIEGATDTDENAGAEETGSSATADSEPDDAETTEETTATETTATEDSSSEQDGDEDTE